MSNIFCLNDFVVVQALGPDSVQFLNSISTNNIKKLNKGNSQHNLFLNIKAHLIADVFIYKVKEGELLLLLHSAFLNNFIKHVNFYKLKSDVIFSKKDYNVYYAKDDSFVVSINDFVLSDSRDSKLGNFIITKKEYDVNNDYLYSDYLISHNMAYPDKIPTGKIFLNYNFPDYNCISYDKGCYLGQEIVMRAKSSGEVKRMIKMFTKNTSIRDNAFCEISDEGIVDFENYEVGKLISFDSTEEKMLVQILKKYSDMQIIDKNGNIWH